MNYQIGSVSHKGNKKEKREKTAITVLRLQPISALC